MDDGLLRGEERLLFSLRGLYQRYGYTQYKMCGFEEYDLYAQNRDFLLSDHMITFTDTGGRLMALKPDVTLSIVRTGKDEPGAVQRLYYQEKVYRVGGFSHNYEELTQTGVECVGSVDDCHLAEVLTLAAESLRRISPDSALHLSHLGVVTRLLDQAGLTGDRRRRALAALADKNVHGLRELLTDQSPECAEPLLCLASLTGRPESVLPELEKLGCPEEAAALRRLCGALDAFGLADTLRLNFSVVNDLGYYNGIVFQGYVAGVPVKVLSGGQYDRLMAKLGRSSRAVGFAVYMDALERLWAPASPYDVDTVLLYAEGEEPVRVLQAVRELSRHGESVSAQRKPPEKITWRRLARLEKSGVTILDEHA